MAKIDVHMLVLGDEREDWKAKAVASVPTDLCNLHVTDGIRGDLANSRLRGYRQGTCEYASFIDPDDWIEPGTFERCLDYMEAKGTCGVVTEEIVYDYFRGTTYRTRHKHGLSVYRREWIEKQYPLYERGLIQHCVQISSRPEIVQMDFVGRHWRKYPSTCFKLRKMAGAHDNVPETVDARPEWD